MKPIETDSFDIFKTNVESPTAFIHHDPMPMALVPIHIKHFGLRTIYDQYRITNLYVLYNIELYTEDLSNSHETELNNKISTEQIITIWPSTEENIYREYRSDSIKKEQFYKERIKILYAALLKECKKKKILIDSTYVKRLTSLANNESGYTLEQLYLLLKEGLVVEMLELNSKNLIKDKLRKDVFGKTKSKTKESPILARSNGNKGGNSTDGITSQTSYQYTTKNGDKIIVFDKGYPEHLINREIILPDCLNSPKLRAKFDKHGKAFGLKGHSFNKATAELFKQRIVNHIRDPNTKIIIGTHRRKEQVVHYYNARTKINIMKDVNGKYVSGWKLAVKQKNSLLNKGNIQ